MTTGTFTVGRPAAVTGRAGGRRGTRGTAGRRGHGGDRASSCRRHWARAPPNSQAVEPASRASLARLVAGFARECPDREPRDRQGQLGQRDRCRGRVDDRPHRRHREPCVGQGERQQRQQREHQPMAPGSEESAVGPAGVGAARERRRRRASPPYAPWSPTTVTRLPLIVSQRCSFGVRRFAGAAARMIGLTSPACPDRGRVVNVPLIWWEPADASSARQPLADRDR